MKPADPTPSAQQRVRLHPDVLIQRVGGESVLLSLASDAYFSLDATGTRMLQVLQESASMADAVDRLLEEYAVDRPTLERDLLELAGECAARGLVEIH